jgi:threonine dehydratase
VKRLRPEIKIIGVEPVDADAMTQSLKAGKRVRLSNVGYLPMGLRCGKSGKKRSVCVRNMSMKSFWWIRMTPVQPLKTCLRIRDRFRTSRSTCDRSAKAYVEREQIEGQTLVPLPAVLT